MSINCSENCIYQSDGVCTLTHITNSSGKIINDCPYFKSENDFIESTNIDKKEKE